MASDDTWVLQDALELVQQFSSSSTSSRGSKVCQKSCNILRAAFGHVADFLSEMQHLTMASSSRTTSFIWKEVVAVIQRGLQLIRSYEGDDWVITALLCEESREEFQDVHSDLYDCIELVSAFMFQNNMDRSKVSQAFNTFIMRRISSSMLESAAVDDRRQLMRHGLAAQEDDDKNVALHLLSEMLLEKTAPMIDQNQLKFKGHLGHGAYGTVYEATWLDHSFAVKVFSPGETSIVSFQRELAALASSKHPNIVRILGYSHDSNKQQRFLVMEKMDMALSEFLLRKQLTVLDSISILLQIAKAMAWLHSRDVIHRDLKPQNVLVVGEEELLRVKVADFGLARTNFVTSRVSCATENQGTRIFMAPEVWNSNHYSKRSDVFSYAMISYQLLTGEFPFDKETLESTDFMLRVRNGMRPCGEFPASCPLELAELTRLCWRGDPNERPEFSEICTKLKLLKDRMITDITNLADARKSMLASTASTQNSNSQSQSISRVRVNLRRPSHQASPQQSTPSRPSRDEYSKRPSPHSSNNSGTNNRDELFALVQKGNVAEAFSKAVSLRDHRTVWWLCSKLEPSLLLVFNQQMVLSVAEQINNDLGEDTLKKIDWLGKAVELLMKDYTAWSSTRLEKFYEQLCQNLHGQLAVAPKPSELAEFLTAELQGANIWLQRVRTACSSARFFRQY